MSRYFIIDLRTLRGRDNSIIIKELAFASYQSIFHSFAICPYKRKEINDEKIINYNKDICKITDLPPWESGILSYKKVLAITERELRDCTRFFTIGNEHLAFLSNLFEIKFERMKI